MKNIRSVVEFEEALRSNIDLPQPEPGFVNGLWKSMMKQGQSSMALRSTSRFGWVWRFGLVVLVIIVAVVLAVGPQKVLAQVRSWLGYNPQLGLVDTTTAIRVLKEPVSQIREGITVEVAAAVLDATKTKLDFRVSGVPREAYPEHEKPGDCKEMPWIESVDGGRFEMQQLGVYEAIPQDVDSAIFVLPCIHDTITGTVPVDWRLPIEFIAADAAVPLMPVVVVEQTQGATVEPVNEKPLRTVGEHNFRVEKIIETETGYILGGTFALNMSEVTSPYWTSPQVVVRDANGRLVATTYPEKARELLEELAGRSQNKLGWLIEFDARDVAYPLTLSYVGWSAQMDPISLGTPFAIDTALIPPYGQALEINQDMEINGRSVRLLNVSRTQIGLYAYQFKLNAELSMFDIKVIEQPANWSDYIIDREQGTYTVIPVQESLPVGLVHIQLFNVSWRGEEIAMEIDWAPATPHTSMASSADGLQVCVLDEEKLDSAQPVTDLKEAQLLIYEPIPEKGTYGLFVYNAANTEKQLIAINATWGEFSPDGRTVAYSGADQLIHIHEIESDSDRILSGVSGYNISWSPDGTRLSYINTAPTQQIGLAVVNLDGSGQELLVEDRQISNIGWSADGKALFYKQNYFPDDTSATLNEYDLMTHQSSELLSTSDRNFMIKANQEAKNELFWVTAARRGELSIYARLTGEIRLQQLFPNASVLAADKNWALGKTVGVDWQSRRLVLIQPDSCQVELLDFELTSREFFDLWIP